MSVRERRNRKDSRAKTWQQLHAWHCKLCMQKITHSQIRRGHIRGTGPFDLRHWVCPGWP